MLIRYGYEMTFTCGVPTSMVSQLDVHPSCVPAVRAETPFTARPHVVSWLYADVFGNRCRRFNAPSGDLTISNAGVIEVSGLPDPVAADAAEIPVADLPDDTLLYLVGSRYVETDKLSQIAWDHFGQAAPDWPRVPRSAISSMATSPSATRAPVRRGPRMKPMPNASAYAGISRILR